MGKRNVAIDLSLYTKFPVPQSNIPNEVKRNEESAALLRL